MKPGELISGTKPIQCNTGRKTVSVTVTNTSEYIIYIASHYHFFEVNLGLQFARESTFGMHLDIPAGTTIRWTCGEMKHVQLTEYAGKKKLFGFQKKLKSVPKPVDDL